MKFELGLECPDPKRPLRSAAAIGLSYAVGGLIPLLPYMVLPLAHDAMFYSVWTTALALFAFGAYKVRHLTTFQTRQTLTHGRQYGPLLAHYCSDFPLLKGFVCRPAMVFRRAGSRVYWAVRRVFCVFRHQIPWCIVFVCQLAIAMGTSLLVPGSSHQKFLKSQ